MKGPAVLRALLLATAACASVGCVSTSSTEVGVRTNLLGIFEARGHQQVYAPGSVYAMLPLVNAWNVLPISQQNLLMNASAGEPERPVPDDITFKTRDGNNVYIDVNVMWRIDPDPAKVGRMVMNVGSSVEAIRERVLRPVSRSVIRDIFNEITSEEYYQVTVKNAMAAKAKAELAAQLEPLGVIVDMLQVQQHRFDGEYQAAINAQKQAEADVQTLIEQQKNMVVQKGSELEGKRSQWNQALEGAIGEAGRIKNEADGYYQTRSNEAKALIAVAQAEAEGIRKEAEALGRMGGDAYVKTQIAKDFATKHMLIVPGSNVSTMDVNKMVEYLMAQPKPGP